MCHHAEEPAVEQFLPIRIGTWHQVGQGADAVFSVPASRVIQIFFDGIVQGDEFRVQETVHIAVPDADALLQGTDGDTVAHTLVQRLEVEVDGVSLALFQSVQHRVVAEFIAAVHEFFQQKSRFLLAAQAVFLPESLAFLIEVVQNQPYRLFIGPAVIMDEGLPHCFFLGYACLVAMFDKADEQRLQVIPPFPILHFVECPDLVSVFLFC